MNLKLTVLLNHMYQINITSILPITFVPGVNLHLTKSTVIRIKKYVKDEDGIVAVSRALESMIGSSSGACTTGKELRYHSFPT